MRHVVGRLITGGKDLRSPAPGRPLAEEAWRETQDSRFKCRLVCETTKGVSCTPYDQALGEGSVSGYINLGVVSLHLLQALMLGEPFKRMSVDWKRMDGA